MERAKELLNKIGSAVLSQTRAWVGKLIQAPRTNTVTAKVAIDVHVTTAPEAVRALMLHGLVGRFKRAVRSFEMTEYCPWHMVSMAHTCADDNGGGFEEPTGTRKALNLGGGSIPSVGSVDVTEATAGVSSRSDVSESEEAPNTA